MQFTLRFELVKMVLTNKFQENFKDIWYVSDIFFRKKFPTSPIWRVFRDQFSIFYGINFTLHAYDMIINSFVDYAPDCQDKGPGFDPLLHIEIPFSCNNQA
jgi:hypothetical protein